MTVLGGAAIAGLLIAAIIILMVENWRRVEPWIQRFDWASDLLFAAVLVLGAADQWGRENPGIALIPALGAALCLLSGVYKLRRRTI